MRLLQRCCWIFKSSGIWRRVTRLNIPEDFNFQSINSLRNVNAVRFQRYFLSTLWHCPKVWWKTRISTSFLFLGKVVYGCCHFCCKVPWLCTMWRTSNAVHCTQHETSNTCVPELYSYMKSSPHTTPQRVHRSFWQHSQSVVNRSNRTVAFLYEFELCESEIQYCDITQKLPKFHFMHKTGNTAHPKK